jgi:predicted O-methyltransferase YrrM
MGVPLGNRETVAFIKTTGARVIAEVGINVGCTSIWLAQYLNRRGELHLFDYEDRVREVKAKLNTAGYDNIVGHGNTHRIMDSYNWSLMRVLQQRSEPFFDYVYLDGAHTWNVDALAFLLLDRLLKVGGYIDFDDYDWSLEKSKSMNPRVSSLTRESFTDKQISESHVRLVVDLLVKRDPRYTEIRKNKIYQKVA